MTEVTKTDKRITDIISKCGATNPEKECTFFKVSKWTNTCMYQRFGFVCDRQPPLEEKKE